MLVGSNQGGMDIEAVAANTPEAIIKQFVDINAGFLNVLTVCTCNAAN